MLRGLPSKLALSERTQLDVHRLRAWCASEFHHSVEINDEQLLLHLLEPFGRILARLPSSDIFRHGAGRMREAVRALGRVVHEEARSQWECSIALMNHVRAQQDTSGLPVRSCARQQ
jgi:hypothetical protein